MTGKVLEVENIIEEDRMATEVANMSVEWEMLRATWKASVMETRQYVFATDTSQTSNSSLPWKNKTTVPKLCQIRDNIYANYDAVMFPQRKPVVWDANEKDANSRQKRDAITNYIQWSMEQPSFRHEMDKVLLDYIDYGNCFVTVEWLDQRTQKEDGEVQGGYVGPAVRRISPMDITFNPTAESFQAAPKIVRSLVSRGEVKKMLEAMSNDENREEYENLWKYLKDIRNTAENYDGDWQERNNLYQIAGFSSFRDYLKSDFVEILTFYGDIYDADDDKFLENHVITVVDRHKLIGKKPNPSFFGYPPIYHAAWRKRQDNLWGMGPLDNLVGMQYRMDHVENMKADIFDLVTYPVQKVKGFVESYTWQPGEQIYLDAESDVDLVQPDVNALQANFEIQNLERLMEEMAGAPREAMGFRTPGEKTKYEVQRMENAAARLFQNKIRQFEELILEPLLNSMLELARRNLTGSLTIKVFDNDLNEASFQTLTVEDITGIGRIKPIAARHFAEQAQLVQDLTALTSSGLWPFIQTHFSSFKLAQMMGKILNLDSYDVVQKDVFIGEQADAQRLVHSLQQQVASTAGTATGIGTDFDVAGGPPVQLQGP